MKTNKNRQIMTKTLTQTDITDIIADIKSYIKQTESVEERVAYTEELEQVQNDFLALVKSGVFHDACGKVLGIRSCFGRYEVIITIDY
jgi:hypothetical protein